MSLIKIDKMSRLNKREIREGWLKMLVNNEISRRVLDVTIDIQWWWLHNNIVLIFFIALLNGIVDTCTTGKQSRRKIVATCWEWMDFSWLSMREFSSLSSSDIFCVLLIAFLCHGKILFLFTATFNSFSSHCLTRSTSCSAFYASFLKYKVSTYGIYLYKNSLDDFSAMWFYDNDIEFR